MDWLEEMERDAEERRRAAIALDNDPAYQARMKAKRDEEFARGVRLGWWDAEGNPIDQPEDDDEEEED